jgi:hypothetical protein
MSELQERITRIEPVYDFDKVAGGYFKIYYGVETDATIKLSFVPFLDNRIRQSDELFKYLKKTSKDKTVSHAIYDLYDIGFPVDEWVEEYIETAKNSANAELFNALIHFYNHIKNFNTGSIE